MYETIVVPLDGSPVSRRALAPAALLARAWCVPLQLVTVESPGIDPLEAAQQLEREIEDLDAPVRPSVVLASNDVAVALADHVRAVKPALLCMATHGRTALGSAVLGSTASAVLDAAEEPVLLVGPRCEPQVEQRDVCVAVDPSSDRSARAMGPAIDWARSSGARLHLVSAIRSADLRLIGDDAAREVLTQLSHEAWVAGVTTGWRVVTCGDDIAAAIVDEAKHESASVIVLATRARRSVARVVLGSVAQQVVRWAPCPVLAIPPHAACGVQD